MSADDILKSVLEAMQPAEEIGGPEAPDYIVLMESIAREAQRRADVCRRTGTSDGDRERLAVKAQSDLKQAAAAGSPFSY